VRRRDASNTSAQSPHALLHEALPTMWTHILDRSPRVRTRSFSAQLQYLPSHSDPDGLRHVVLTRPEVRPDTVYSPHPCGSPFGPARAVQIRSRRICLFVSSQICTPASFRHSVARLPLPSACTFKTDIFDILLLDFVQGTFTLLDRAYAGHTQIATADLWPLSKALCLIGRIFT